MSTELQITLWITSGWLLCGFISYGLWIAKGYDTCSPIIGVDDWYLDRMAKVRHEETLHALIFGPIALIVNLFVTNFGKYGWRL